MRSAATDSRFQIQDSRFQKAARLEVGELVSFRVRGCEVRAMVLALFGAWASVRIAAAGLPRWVGTDWTVAARRLTQVVESGRLFARNENEN